MTPAFALFRLPGEHVYTEMRQYDDGAQTVPSYRDLAGKRGFVIAPFAIGDDCPLMIIAPERTAVHDVPPAAEATCCCGAFTKDRTAYDGDFERFHEALADGRFKKIVLSRSSEAERCGTASDRDIFVRACNLYPDLFVALFSAPSCGTWLMATPEILIEGSQNRWHTMALAGTMRNAENCEWSGKNIREQKYVEDYIGDCLSAYSDDVRIEGPFTSHAGNLIHLRSDFFFSLRNTDDLGRVIERMHPTPAVCGLPKSEAMSFILGGEHSPRLYYSGFSGIIDSKGDTHLFVSLRCMNISEKCFTLYAGGGLLDASTAETEWLETEAKMETMKNCIL